MENRVLVSEPNDGGGPTLLLGFFLGACAGVALAMLVTPQTGEDTRELLAAKAREAADRAREIGGKMPVGPSDLLERGRAIVEGARARLDSAISEGRSAAEKQRDDLGDQA